MKTNSLQTMVMIMLIFLMGYVYYVQFVPFEVVRLHSFETVEKNIKAGDTLTVKIKFEKRMDYDGKFNWILNCAEPFPIPSISQYRPVGTHDLVKKIKIPKEAKGSCTIRVHIKYEITPTRPINLVWESNKFNVL